MQGNPTQCSNEELSRVGNVDLSPLLWDGIAVAWSTQLHVQTDTRTQRHVLALQGMSLCTSQELTVPAPSLPSDNVDVSSGADTSPSDWPCQASARPAAKAQGARLSGP